MEKLEIRRARADVLGRQMIGMAATCMVYDLATRRC